MSAGSYNIQIEQGATWRVSFALTDDDGPVDLTDFLVRSQFRVSVADASVLFELTSEPTTGDRFIIEDQSGPDRGKFTGFIDPDTSSTWTWRDAVYDMELQAPGSDPDVIRLLQGSVKVSPEVTR